MLTRQEPYADLPTVETERLLLRKLEERDLSDVYEYCSDGAVVHFMTWEAHPSIARSRAVITEILEQYRAGRGGPWGIVHREDRKLIGTINLGWPTFSRN